MIEQEFMVEVRKLTLEPNEKLIITIKSPEIDLASLQALRKVLKEIFPNNELGLIGLGLEDKFEITVVKSEEKSYCSDCTCGKKGCV